MATRRCSPPRARPASSPPGRRADHPERDGDALAAVVLGEVRQQQRQLDVLEGREHGNQVEELEDEPTWRARQRASSPSERSVRRAAATTTSPSLGRSRPARTSSRVDLPEPDGPIRTTKRPAGTCSDTCSRACTSSAPRRYRRETLRRSIRAYLARTRGAGVIRSGPAWRGNPQPGAPPPAARSARATSAGAASSPLPAERAAAAVEGSGRGRAWPPS